MVLQGVELPYAGVVAFPRVVANQTATMQSKNFGSRVGANLVIVLRPASKILWDSFGHNLIRLAHYFISSRMAP